MDNSNRQGKLYNLLAFQEVDIDQKDIIIEDLLLQDICILSRKAFAEPDIPRNSNQQDNQYQLKSIPFCGICLQGHN